MAIILVILALISGVIGFFSISQATTGVGFLAAACLLAILARISQADKHHKEVIEQQNAIIERLSKKD